MHREIKSGGGFNSHTLIDNKMTDAITYSHFVLRYFVHQDDPEQSEGSRVRKLCAH